MEVPTLMVLTLAVVTLAAVLTLVSGTAETFPAAHVPMTFTVTIQEPSAGIEPPVNVTLELPPTAVSAPPQVVVALPETCMPLGNESVNGAVKFAAAASGLFKVMVSNDTALEVTVVGLKVLLSVGAITGRALTVRVATAGAVLLPLLVCRAPAGKVLK